MSPIRQVELFGAAHGSSLPELSLSPPDSDHEPPTADISISEDFSEAEYMTSASEDDDDDSCVVPFKRIMSAFSIYLASPLGKELDASTIDQHIYQLTTLMKFSNSRNLYDLLTITVINNVFQKLKLSKKQGGKAFLNQTLRGYISSIKHLTRFF